MRKLIVTMMTVLSVAGTAFGQWIPDTVRMGASSINDVFYSLNNGTVKTENNKNWHLAFALGGMSDSGAVWANHNAGTNFVKVFNIHKDFSQWSSVALGDTAGADLCFNNDQGWFQGALNNVPSTISTQYGWGHYAGSPSHDVIGDSIFIIQADGIYYKFFINSWLGSGPDAGNWNFQLGDFSGSTTFDTIKAVDYPNRRFAYYDLDLQADTNREPVKASWDLLFNRYTTDNPLSGPSPFNNVIGALSNRGLLVSKADVVHVDSAFAHYGDYVVPWPATSNVISAVGYNWKTFAGTWSVPDSVSYFIQDIPGNCWQLQFTAYSGSSTGVISLRKRMVVPVAVNDIHSAVSRYELFPVPANNELNINLDGKESSDAIVSITAMNGQVLYKAPLHIKSGMNTYVINTAHLVAGNYILNIQGNKVAIQSKFSTSN